MGKAPGEPGRASGADPNQGISRTNHVVSVGAGGAHGFSEKGSTDIQAGSWRRKVWNKFGSAAGKKKKNRREKLTFVNVSPCSRASGFLVSL